MPICRTVFSFPPSPLQENSSSGLAYRRPGNAEAPPLPFSDHRRDCPAGVQTFLFHLSNIGKDNPQGSFDCIQQYTSRIGHTQLDCLGSIQDKIAIRATDESYEKAKQTMAQVEEETRSRGAIVIKPGGRYVGKTVKIRRPAPAVSDAVPSRVRPTPVNLASAIKKGNSAVSQRPLRDRVVHLLALKPYKKPELLLRLQKDGLSPHDKDALDGLLQQVANASAKDGTCTLKDCLYKEVQRNWPGYSDGDQQLLKRVLFRKLCPPPNDLPPENLTASSPKDSANAPSSSPPQKRPHPPEFTDPLLSKKHRISHYAQRTQATLNGKLKPTSKKEVPSPFPAAPADTAGRSPIPAAPEPPRPHDPLHNVSSEPGCSKDSHPAEPTKVAAVVAAQLATDPAPADKPSPARHCKAKRKMKRHQEEEQLCQEGPDYDPEEGSSGMCLSKSGRAALPLNSRLFLLLPGLNGMCSGPGSSVPMPDLPDYLLKYSSILCAEQRQSYKNDFNAEYGEYRSLYARIEQITRRFMELDSQLKQLSPGSDEYKMIHDQILQEYRKIKKTNRNYSQEKNRCEYLHNKLAHIKRMIAEYDHKQFPAWP
uniref:Elongation factor for RNA polymerase II n=1 Tax=Varanus komodoensis TaxID=61221 RepID=A0A8D2IX90_VARKO